MQVSDFTAILKVDFGHFRPVSACFRHVSACFGRIGRRPIWPIRPDFGRISPIRRESKPIRHESSRLGANRAESARIREKKKKKKPRRGPTRGQPRRTPRPASDAGAAPLVPRSCILGKEYIGRYIDINPLSFVCCPMQSHYVNKNKNKPFIMNFIGRGLIPNITILIK